MIPPLGSEVHGHQQLLERKTQDLQIAFAIETTENHRTLEIRRKCIQESRKITSFFVNKGWIKQGDIDLVERTWASTIIADSVNIRKLVDTLHPEEDDNITEMTSLLGDDDDHVRRLRQSLEEQKRYESEVVPAFIPEFTEEQKETFKQTSLAQPLIVINQGAYEKINGTELDGVLEGEETLHLLSNFKEKYGIHNIWFEEVMARYIGYTVLHKSKPQEIKDIITVKARFNDFVQLYRKLNAELTDKDLLVKMFFGQVELSDSRVGSVKDILKRFNNLGNLVNSGLTLEDAQAQIEKLTLRRDVLISE